MLEITVLFRKEELRAYFSQKTLKLEDNDKQIAIHSSTLSNILNFLTFHKDMDCHKSQFL